MPWASGRSRLGSGACARPECGPHPQGPRPDVHPEVHPVGPGVGAGHLTQPGVVPAGGVVPQLRLHPRAELGQDRRARVAAPEAERLEVDAVVGRRVELVEGAVPVEAGDRPAGPVLAGRHPRRFAEAVAGLHLHVGLHQGDVRVAVRDAPAVGLAVLALHREPQRTVDPADERGGDEVAQPAQDQQQGAPDELTPVRVVVHPHPGARAGRRDLVHEGERAVPHRAGRVVLVVEDRVERPAGPVAVAGAVPQEQTHRVPGGLREHVEGGLGVRAVDRVRGHPEEPHLVVPPAVRPRRGGAGEVGGGLSDGRGHRARGRPPPSPGDRSRGRGTRSVRGRSMPARAPRSP